MADSFVIYMTKFLSLQNRDSLSPTPKKSPESAQIKFHVFEPGMRKKREAPPTLHTPITLLRCTINMSRMAYGAEHILAKDTASEIGSYLRF